jgi:hypothetical protein
MGAALMFTLRFDMRLSQGVATARRRHRHV